MSRVLLVRHGHAAAGWGEDLDPGLDDLGRDQARAMAAAIEIPASARLITSPLRRCVETARAIEDRSGLTAAVVDAVGEVPSPDPDLDTRQSWLAGFMAKGWTAQPPELVGWRDAVVEAVRGVHGDTIIVSHFVAINAVVGYATGDDRVVCFRPDNCSWRRSTWTVG